MAKSKNHSRRINKFTWGAIAILFLKLLLAVVPIADKFIATKKCSP